MKKCIFIVMVAVILLAIPSFPAKAAAKHIPISGLCRVVNAWQAEDFRYWENWKNVHWRDMIWQLQCDYDDDRLDGYIVVFDNWNMVWIPGQWIVSAHTHSYAFSSDEFGMKLDLWETRSNTSAFPFSDSPDGISHVVLHGLGIYKGLQGRTSWSVFAPYVYYVEGELLDPGS